MSLSPGARLGAYEVVALLGSGGMGDVFLAEDTRLHRRVAIKRVRADATDGHADRRLLTEARAAAQLDHPHICAIYEVGEDAGSLYIVMPLLEGETLAARLTRGPLPVDEALRIASQVADALAAAHARGILHRDIKPANIMIGASGQVRVMDFGLAKFLDDDAASAAETQTQMTRHGDVLGTATYMSPEQVRGERVDPRTDLFSLGVVIYEMIAGRRPFDGATVADILSAVLTHDPANLALVRPGVPDECARITAKLMCKTRDERYRSAADLVVDLRSALHAVPTVAAIPVRNSARWWLIAAVIVAVAGGGWLYWRARGSAATGSRRIASLAVLPLDNLSNDPSKDYVAAAMTEELTRALAGVKSLRVISRTSTEQYRGKRPPTPEIARALNVEGVIEGSVVRDGDRVRITAQLIDAPSDRHVWANSYDGDLRDLLGLERRVAEAIAIEVRAAVTPDEQRALRSARSVDPRAMETYLKARELHHAGVTQPPPARQTLIDQAIAVFADATAIQPDFAEALAARAISLHWRKRYVESEASARQALRIDDGIADAHGALGYDATFYDYDPATAEREFRRAFDLDPNSEEAGAYSMFLTAMGRHAESKAMVDRYLLVDPSRRTSLDFQNVAFDAALKGRDYPEALRIARNVDVPTWRHLWIGMTLLFQGRPSEAIPEIAQGRSGAVARSYAGVALARANRRAEARAALTSIEKAGEGSDAEGAVAVAAARVYANLGETTKAIEALERAFSARAWDLPFIHVDQSFDPIRDDPRFRDLIRRLGMPQ
jgi:serine/threonine-protein kinase